MLVLAETLEYSQRCVFITFFLKLFRILINVSVDQIALQEL